MSQRGWERLAFCGYMALFWIIILLPWRFEWPASWSDAFFPERVEAPPGSFWVPIFVHLGLFLPTGVLLHRGLRWGGFALSLAALSELSQVFVRRHATLDDVGVNLLGCAIGYFLAPQLLAVWRVATRRGAAVCYLVILTGILVYLIPERTTHWGDWDREYRAHFCNEGTLDRPWTGVLYSVDLWDNAGGVGEPLASWDFRKGLPEGVAQREGPEPLFSNGMQVDWESGFSAEFDGYDALLDSNELTLRVVFRPDRTTHVYSGRLFSLSETADERNITFGQNAGGLFVRVRNNLTDLNGFWPELRTEPILAANREYVATVIATGNETTLLLDGVQVATTRFSHLNSWIGKLLSQVPTPELLAALWALWAVMYAWVIGWLL